MTSEWYLQECGFNQAAFSPRPKRQAEVKGNTRTLCSFTSDPPLHVTASFAWDASYVFAELTSKKIHTVTLGRWQGLLGKVEGQLAVGDRVTKVMEVGEKVLFKTMTKNVLVSDSASKNVSVLELGQTACIKCSHIVGDKLIVLFDDGSLHLSPVNSNPLLGSHYPLEWAVKEVACGSDHVVLLEEGRGRVWTLGLNHRGQLGHGDLCQRMEPSLIEALDGLKMTAVSCGRWHNLVLSECGDLYSWGWNAHKQLGHSPDLATITTPHLVDMNEADVFGSVSCGARHSAALTVCGKLLTWGWNAYGQLGHSEEAGPAVVRLPVNTVVSWMYCGPWSTLFISKSN